MKTEFPRQIFEKNYQISNFAKILPVGVELIHVDRHDEANRCFSQFCGRAQKTLYGTHIVYIRSVLFLRQT